MTDRLVWGGICTLCASLATTAILGGTVLWKDVEVLKSQVAMNKEELALRSRSADQFEEFLTQMKLQIAVQTESVNGLKKAVERLEQTVYSFKEIPNDSRN